MPCQEILHLVSNDWRQFFNLQGDHKQKTHAHGFWIAKLSAEPDQSGAVAVEPGPPGQI